MDPVLYTFKGIEIRWYSILILLGVVLAYFLIITETKRQKIKTDFIFNLVFWGLIFGIIGARLYYVVLILDILVPGVLLAQCIGRWGNFFNSEAYGSIVSYETLVNIKIIPQFIIDNMLINGEYHLPMFYFESIACLIGVIFMLIYRRYRYIKNGQILSFYLIWYGIVRLIIESFRTDSLMLADFKIAQVVSIIMIFIGLYITISQKQKPKLEDLYNKYDEEIKF